MNRVLVCGSTFGAVHACAVDRADDLQLAGLFASGSERSKTLARAYGVPLWTGVEHVPRESDAVASVVLRSAALGGHGTELAEKLMDSGWNILLEQPVRADEIKHLLASATRNKVILHVGNLYLRLPAVAMVTRVAGRMRGRIRSVRISASSQTLLPAAALLRRLVQGGSPRIEHVSTHAGVTTCIGCCSDTGFTLTVHNEQDSVNRDDGLLALLGAEIITDAGVLAMADCSGPALWYPRLEMGRLDAFGLPAGLPGSPHRGLVLSSSPGWSLDDFIRIAWTAAIAEDIRACARASVGSGSDRRQLARSIADATWWTLLSREIGLPAQAEREAWRLDAAWFEQVRAIAEPE